MPSKVEWLRTAAFGWSSDWPTAMSVATRAARKYGQRHRVYWSPQANAWMIRRAFDLSAERRP